MIGGMSADKLLLLDTPSLYFRAFYGIPESVTAPDGTPVNAVRGLLDFIARLVRDFRPTRLVAAMDGLATGLAGGRAAVVQGTSCRSGRRRSDTGLARGAGARDRAGARRAGPGARRSRRFRGRRRHRNAGNNRRLRRRHRDR